MLCSHVPVRDVRGRPRGFPPFGGKLVRSTKKLADWCLRSWSALPRCLMRASARTQHFGENIQESYIHLLRQHADFARLLAKFSPQVGKHFAHILGLLDEFIGAISVPGDLVDDDTGTLGLKGQIEAKISASES
jgi:hypothetical protein